MKTTYLDKIRAAVIAAVPDLPKGCGCGMCGYCDAFGKNHVQTITLADVLLAIDKFYPQDNIHFIELSMNGVFSMMSSGGGYEPDDIGEQAEWNLHKNLEDQEEPTLKFLADLFESK